MKIGICFALILCASIMGITSVSVGAHGFGPRYDLPVPLYLYLSGAGLAVALSFAVISVFIKGVPGGFEYPTLHLLNIRRGESPLIFGGIWIFRIGSLLLFILTMVAGAFGAQEPVRNLAPTMVWIIFWVGLGIAVPLIGNLWEFVNPWKTMFDLFDATLNRVVGSQLSRNVPYNKRYALIPGLVFFGVFGWIENAYTDAAVPRHIAFLGTSYALSMIAGMLIFGKRTWLENGDLFTILFKRLAGFGFLELRNDDTEVCITCEEGCEGGSSACIECYTCIGAAARVRLVARPWAMGLARAGILSSTGKIFVIGILAIVSFDGFSETPVWASIINTSLPWMATTFPVANDVYFLLMVISTTGLVITGIVFLVAYQLTIQLMSTVTRGAVSADQLAGVFVVTLLPIAVAYHLAHYLSLFAVQGQLLIPLISDPLGAGLNLLGTADYKVNIGLISSKFLWYFSVITIVLGHVVAVYLAHVLSIGIFNDGAKAIKSQYPMVLLMIGYTVISLWIIAQPITEVRIA